MAYIPTGNPVGHPPIWKTANELEEKLKGFWAYCKENDDIPDIEALACYLEIDRSTIRDYERKEEFAPTIKRVKTRIAKVKKQLAMKGKINPAVFCFDFKNNHDYTDQQEILSKNMNINVDVTPEDEDFLLELKNKYTLASPKT